MHTRYSGAKGFSTILTRQVHRLFVVSVLFVLSSIYFFIFSESGLLERISLERKKGDILARIEQQKNENDRLLSVFEKYKKGEMSERDLAKAGYVASNGKILHIKGIDDTKSDEKAGRQKGDFFVAIPHLRIFWAVLSSLVVIVLLSRRFEREDL